MPLFTRPTPLPPSVRTDMALAKSDRVIAAAEVTGGWAIATRLALYLSDATDGPGLRRRPWADVDRASLDPETAVLTVGWVDGRTEELQLLDNRQPAFARAVYERVQWSVVHAETVTLGRGAQVRVALRRDEAGGLFSQVTGKGRVDLSDPRVAALVDAVEARVRGAAGLPQ